jgi:hypothetical protein
MIRNFLPVILGAVLAIAGMEPAAWAQFAQAPSEPQYPAQGQYAPPGYPQSQAPQYQGDQQTPQYSAGSDSESDPADRQHGVARISIVQGDVNVRRGDTGQLEAAAINAPMMASDHLQTSPGSRAEIELDNGNLIRLGPNTDVGFADLEYRRYQVQLGAGTIIYRVLRDAGSQAEIDTPSIAVRPLGVGEYRISALEDGTTQITVRSGQAEIDSPNGSEQLAAGRTTLVRGNPNQAEFQTTGEIARDQFDDWSANRDRELLASQSYNYVSPDIYGADDLDRYGNWVPSQYGQVWQPQAPTPDWSPYSDGQWDFEPYYGWTWVDAAPWGWAPYHYGRWFQNGGHGWCWWPGAIRASYGWHPAEVGFFGWGGGVGIGFGGLGWVALAPFEAFHPWWGHGYFGAGGWGGWYGRNGFGGRQDIGRMYRNAAFRGGAMTTGYNRFSGPNQRFSPATRGQLTNATLFRGQLPVSPTRASYQFSNRRAVANPRLASAGNRQFFHSPQSAFGHTQTAYGRNQTGFTGGANSRFNAGQNAHGVAPNMRGNFAQGSVAGRGNYAGEARQSAPASGGWQRFGDPRGSATVRQNFAQGNEQSGWHRFGQPPPASYGGSRMASPQNENRYSGRSYGGGSYGSYAAPRQGFGGGYGAPSAPRYSAPAAPRYSAPAMPRYSAPSGGHYSAPHYSAPSNRGGGGGSFHGGGGGGSSRSGGGGGHSSGGGGGHHR